MSDFPQDHGERRRWMGILARSSAAAMTEHLEAVPPLPSHTRLRGPETGLVMLRGRAGGDGAAFNLSEAVVTRCSITLSDGRMGHAYILGRDDRKAELAAVLDAALQDPERRPALLSGVIAPLAAAQAAGAEATARKAAATRVQFFTMASMR
nr:phosphonate C-P lyase system protein PhnG [Roseomonas sp. KE0001]